eukprot:427165-Prymnesium_polylepis.1
MSDAVPVDGRTALRGAAQHDCHCAAKRHFSTDLSHLGLRRVTRNVLSDRTIYQVPYHGNPYPPLAV